ncbi:cytochrome P450 [Serendipita vermifera]|nr:cytochrome P450 [Serendipita vermifera]
MPFPSLVLGQDSPSYIMDGLVSSKIDARLLSGFALLGLGWVAFKGLKHTTLKGTQFAYPPGPPREILIGSLRSFPKDHFFRQFCQWAETYGEIVYAPLPGMNIIILNSYEIAQEVLSRRPSSTAGRQVGYLLATLMNWGWSIGGSQPGPSHSNQRRMLRRSIGSQHILSFSGMIETEMAKLATVLRTFSGSPVDTIQGAIGRMVSKATYGEKIWDEMGDDLSKWNLKAVDLTNEVLFNFWLVDILSILRFVPSWFPGTRFQEIAHESRELVGKIRYKAYGRAQELFTAGTLGHCIANDLLTEFGPSDDARDAMAILYTIASDTTTAATVAFLHTMFLFPHVSERIFEEIQAVTSGERLPQVADRSQFPFAEAAWKETLRWSPFIPLGIPHVNSDDEIVHGYLIPKGSIIHQNFGLMLSDPKVWGDPEVFRPERFLEAEAAQRPNPLTTLFGYGMRTCPGMHLADKVVFHLVITVISLLKIVPLEGCSVPDPNTIEYTDAGVRYPIGFECRFVPRNEKAEHLLSSVALSV